jgi:acyl dehydratase
MERTAAEGSNLARGSWEDAEAMVGRTLLRVEGADPVSKADIRRKLEAINFAAPVHEDEAAARAAGFRGVISPVAMMRTWATPAYWRPGDAPTGEHPLYPAVPVTRVPAPGDGGVFGTGTRTRYLRPVHPGDRITATAVLKSVTRKRLSVGPGAFLVVETTYENGNGETVAVEEMTCFRLGEEGEG